MNDHAALAAQLEGWRRRLEQNLDARLTAPDPSTVVTK